MCDVLCTMCILYIHNTLYSRYQEGLLATECRWGQAGTKPDRQSPHVQCILPPRVQSSDIVRLVLGLAMRLYLLMRIDAHQMRINAHEPHQ